MYVQLAGAQRSQLVVEPVASQQRFEPAAEPARVGRAHLQCERNGGLRFLRFQHPQQAQQEHRGEGTDPHQPDTGAEADAERGQHHTGVLRVFDLGAVPDQARDPDDAERAGQAGADHDHHQRADHGEHDLGLDDYQLPRRGAGAARTHREDGAKTGRQREPDHRLEQRLTLLHWLVIGLRHGDLGLLREGS